jgi:hypothetical protein
MPGIGRERILAHGKGGAEQDRAPQAHRGLALVLRVAEVVPAVEAGGLGLVGHDARGAPLVRHGIDLAVDGGVRLHALEQRGVHHAGVDLRKVERLVDVVFQLRRIDAVMAGLGQVKARSARRPQLGNHLLVVREGDLDLDAGVLGLELLDQLIGGVGTPGEDPQRLGPGPARPGQHRGRQ